MGRFGRAVATAVVLGSLGPLLTGCSSAPQILEIYPLQGATNVPSNASIRITFDRGMDKASVQGEFRLLPEARGTFHWLGDREVRWDHAPLQPSTKYQVVLQGGYRDSRGEANTLRHSWIFSTEPPPELAGSSPGSGERGVDTAAYIALAFSREMDVSTLTHAMSISPSTRFTIERDPTDSRRLVVVPEALLEPNQEYSITVTTRARDADGNRLGTGTAVTFTTGPRHGLQHWIGFVAKEPAAGGARSPGVWIVDQNRFPRVLVAAPVSWFAWSPDGERLLLRSDSGVWSDESLKGAATELPFQGSWAAYLAGGRGYVYLDGTNLYTMAPGGTSRLVASGVGEAVVDPGVTRMAYTVAAGTGAEIYAYDTGLDTDYRLRAEPGPIDGLVWSPDGLAVAYRVGSSASFQQQIRVRLLRDGGSTVTVATGDVSTPVWQADSRHVFFTAEVTGPSGPISKLFRFTPGEPPPSSLTAAAGLPSAPRISVGSISASPDGRQVAFLSDSNSPASEVWLMNADGTGLNQLTVFATDAFPYHCDQVTWTPS